MLEISLIVFGMLLVGTVLVFVVKKVSPVSVFLYSNARIQARSIYLVSDRKLRELIECKSLRELSNALRETDYGEELEKTFKDDLKSFHTALEKSFVNSILELRNLAPEKSKPLFNAYLTFLEGKVLKTIYKTKFLKIKLEENLVFSIGNINEILLKHLIEAETVADLAVVLEPTIYADVFSKKYETLEEFEVALDEFILNNFVSVAKKIKMFEAKFIINIINTKVDILNLLVLLKFRIRNIEKEKGLRLLIKNNTPLSLRFNDLINSEALNDFVNSCKGLPCHNALTKALEKYEKDDSLLHFENELYSYYKSFVIDADLYHTLGPYPLFSYLTKKEIEQRNLFVISKCIDAKLPLEKTKEMIL